MLKSESNFQIYLSLRELAAVHPDALIYGPWARGFVISAFPTTAPAIVITNNKSIGVDLPMIMKKVSGIERASRDSRPDSSVSMKLLVASGSFSDEPTEKKLGYLTKAEAARTGYSESNKIDSFEDTVNEYPDTLDSLWEFKLASDAGKHYEWKFSAINLHIINGDTKEYAEAYESLLGQVSCDNIHMQNGVFGYFNPEAYRDLQDSIFTLNSDPFRVADELRQNGFSMKVAHA